MINDKRIYILVGPSGSGKTTLGNFLKNELSIPELVSHTTRQKREGEIDGETYYFVSQEEFDKLEKAEYPENGYAGNSYCLSKKEADTKLEKYNKVFTIMDIVGVHQIRKVYGDIVRVIFIYAPSVKEIENRMKNRGDALNDIERRIKYSQEKNEFNNYIHADYIVCNSNLDFAKERMRLIIHIDQNKQPNFEIERKFLVNNMPPLENIPYVDIIQAYPSLEPEIRVRKEVDQDSKTTYRKTMKSDGDMVRKEIEEEITEKEFLDYVAASKGRIIYKVRYKILIGNYIAELDLYKNIDLQTVEVEFMSENCAKKFIPPKWFGKEITNKKQYKNKNLSQMRLSDEKIKNLNS